MYMFTSINVPNFAKNLHTLHPVLFVLAYLAPFSCVASFFTVLCFVWNNNVGASNNKDAETDTALYRRKHDLRQLVATIPLVFVTFASKAQNRVLAVLTKTAHSLGPETGDLILVDLNMEFLERGAYEGDLILAQAFQYMLIFSFIMFCWFTMAEAQGGSRPQRMNLNSAQEDISDDDGVECCCPGFGGHKGDHIVLGVPFTDSYNKKIGIGNIEFLGLIVCTVLGAMQCIIEFVGVVVVHWQSLRSIDQKTLLLIKGNVNSWQKQLAPVCSFASLVVFVISQIMLRRLDGRLPGMIQGASKKFAAMRWLLMAPTQLFLLRLANHVLNVVKEGPQAPQLFLLHSCLLSFECYFVVRYNCAQWVGFAATDSSESESSLLPSSVAGLVLV
jgi:hypothetical protein